MDLEVVGRHALFFDDDASSAFVNSGDALVEWHSLQIDRYDVRHLLSSPPPPRRRNRSNSERLLFDDPSLEALLDQERYFDLPLDSDQPEVEEDEKPMGTGGYNSVAFSYGNTDDSADHKNTDAGMESSGYLPSFPIPENLLESLPPTEKLHQIIARTAIFVSKHGGQSEIILRVRQGDNPTFGFLMPDHHLHSYFRYLVEHPELLHSENDGNSEDERKKADGDDATGVGGALSMLGSVYGSGEEDDGDDTAKNEKDVAEDSVTVANSIVSRDSEEPMEKAPKDESISRNLIFSNKEKVHAVKKNSSIMATKPKSVKNIKKEENSALFPAAAEKSKSYDVGAASKIEAPIIEPPPELKRLIDKIVEFISRNGKQFEATLIEQDTKPERFPFLLPSNQYHTYYLKVLQKAQESKVNGNSSYSGKDDPVGRGTNKRTSMPKRRDSSSFGSDLSDLPLESDRKEKFKMVIGKSKKETQEPELNGTSESGVMVDAAAAAAILQAATRGIKNSDSQTISSTHPHAHSHFIRSGSLPPSQPDNSTLMSDQSGSCNLSAVKNVASEADSVANLTEEQKLKAERLKRAKMFVAMLKSGSVPSKTGVLRASSAEPAGVSMSSGEAHLIVPEKESSLDPAVVDKISPTGDFERPSDRLSKRKYRSRSGGCEEDVEDEDGHGDKEKHDKSRSRTKYKSIKGDKFEDDVEKEKKSKHYRKRHRSYSSSEESSEEKRDNKRRSHRKDDRYRGEKDHKRSGKKNRSHSSSEESSEEKMDNKHRSHRSHKYEDDKLEDRYEEEKDHKRSSKRRGSHHSSHESSRKRHSSKQKKEHRSSSHRASKHHSRDKKREGSSRDKDSRRHKHDSSSDDEIQHDSGSEQHKRGELEEGEMSPRAAAAEPREITSNVESTQRASSQPYETTDEVPDDLRLKIRAMLLATRL